MEWLNLHTSVLDSPEFIGSDPTERATWLCLMRYCIGQENGGTIEHAKGWKDRQWQQLCRVTLVEVRTACRLFRWEGDSLVLFGYPLSKQVEVQKKRAAGIATAEKRWHPATPEQPRKLGSSAGGSPTRSAGNSARSSADSSATPEQPRKLDAEGKGRKIKESIPIQKAQELTEDLYQRVLEGTVQTDSEELRGRYSYYCRLTGAQAFETVLSLVKGRRLEPSNDPLRSPAALFEGLIAERVQAEKGGTSAAATG